MKAISVGDLSSPAIAAVLDGTARVVVLIPVGSVEPHGPHLPLATDTIISQAVSERAAERLTALGYAPLIAPTIAYGVTDYARDFRGAVSIPPAALTAFLKAVIDGFLVDESVAHVCLVNNHLEPAHDAAVKAAVTDYDPKRASVATPLTRRWARTLSEEFKKGECHAGRYETSIVLAARPELVDLAVAHALPDVHVSLSEKMAAGLDSFDAMGMSAAYSGTPREATAEEGRELIEKLAEMVTREVVEHLSDPATPTT